MDYEGFIQLLNEVGAERILVLYFDNDNIEYYVDKDFDPADAIQLNGELVIKTHPKIVSKSVTGRDGKGGLKDIPITVYNSSLQAVITIDNAADKKRVDRQALYINQDL